MFIPSDLPVELAEVLVGLLVEDCCVAAGAIKVPEALDAKGVPGSTHMALCPTVSTFPCTPICPGKQHRYPVYPSEAAPSTFVVF